MFEITIHIPGLPELAEALKQICGNTKQEAKDANLEARTAQQYVSGSPVEPQAPAPAAIAATTVSQQPQAPVIPQPASVPTAPVAPVPTQPVQMPVAPQAVPVQAAVPTSMPAYTLDDLARAAMVLMDSGRQPDLQKLLTNFGVEALPALPPEQYGAFATALRGMGAQI